MVGEAEFGAVLFVDDDPLVRRVLPRMLALDAPELRCEVAADAEEALRFVEQAPPAVVVADLHMQPVDGLELLGRVRERWPQVVRVLMSGDDSAEVMAQAAGLAHGLVAKPFDPATLVRFLRGALTTSAGDVHRRVGELLGGVDTLPAAPRIYQALLFVLTNPKRGIPEAAEVVARDPAIAAHVLRVASSPFYCRGHAPSDLVTGVSRLGLVTLEALVLSIEAKRSFPLARGVDFDVEAAQRDALLAGHLARRFCRSEDDARRHADLAFVAGLLHGVGALALASRAPEAFGEARQLEAEGWPTADAQRRVMGVSAAEAGAHVLKLWGLPVEVVEALAHQDGDAEEVGPVARALRTALVVTERAKSSPIEATWLEMLGLRPHMPEWRELTAAVA